MCVLYKDSEDDEVFLEKSMEYAPVAFKVIRFVPFSTGCSLINFILYTKDYRLAQS